MTVLGSFRIAGIAMSLLCGSYAWALTQPNILLIVADDLGYSDLGCYGGEINTPNLDALAESGIRLSRFYNTGRCCPSRAAILTGHYPHRVGLGHMTQDLGRPGYRGRVAESAKTIAQHLKPLGYRSFIAGKWHLGTSDPTAHGFEEFYGTLVSAKRFWDPEHFLRLPAQRQRISYQAGEFYGTDAVTDHAMEFLQRARNTPQRPWFLYLAYNAPHFPLHAKPEDIRRYANRYAEGWDEIRRQRLASMKRLGLVPAETKLTDRSTYDDYGQINQGVNPAWSEVDIDRRKDLARRMAIYAAMVDSMDQNIGRVLGDLKSTDQWSNTLILFISDNGACAEWDPWGFDGKSSPQNILHRGDQIETMGGPGTFHSVGSGWAGASNTPWRLYKHYNHEGGINSPCIVHWAEGLEEAQRGTIDHTPAHIIDLLPTFLHAATRSESTDRPVDFQADSAISGAVHDDPLPGVSLLSLLTGLGGEPEGSLDDRDLFFEHEGNRAVISQRWKLVATRSQPWELYDTRVDRTEQKDLAVTLPQQVAELAAKWNQWAAANHVTPLPTDYHVDYLRAE